MQLQYDGSITIATGKSRKETKWKNIELPWSAFLDKISQTKRTGETYEGYQKLTKAQQDEIKDVGGFVGGTLTEGHRRKGSVASRSILTLDADHDPEDLYAYVEMFYDMACAVYSTHKHSAETPRYRLVIPLDRKVSAEEYTALGRKIAGEIGIDMFDDTTYEPERLMYWPSTSIDGLFTFEYKDAPWLKVDELLGKYDDWRDISQWPVSSRAQEVFQTQADKQGNPLVKEGVIGAFCRAYTLEDAIETFLNGVYTPAKGHRYTFVGGSTDGGWWCMTTALLTLTTAQTRLRESCAMLLIWCAFINLVLWMKRPEAIPRPIGYPASKL